MITYLRMHHLFGVRIDDLSKHGLRELLSAWLTEPGLHCIFTPNPEFLLTARKDKYFADLLNQGDLSLTDGVGLKFAIAALTQNHLEHRQTGIDTLMLIADICAQKNKRLLLLGGMNDAAMDAEIVLKQRWPNLDVVSLEPGFIPGDFESLLIAETVLHEIQSMSPDVIAVALGQGKQERFIIELKNQIPSLRIAIGVGGALDTISGRFPRAPIWMQRSGFEWMWRVLIEPKRIHRIFRAVIVFPIVVIWDTLKHRRFWKALKRVTYELKKHFLI